jgi:hypothetical protein
MFGHIAEIDYLCSGEAGTGAFSLLWRCLSGCVNEMLKASECAVIRKLMLTFAPQETIKLKRE